MPVPTQPDRQQILLAGFDEIASPVKPHLRELGRFLEEQVEAFEPEIHDLVRYCFKHEGKRIRALLVFYSGWSGQDTLPRELVRAAAVIELVHLATLVHDDILDSAEIRHNSDTVARKHGPSIAVLLGDALFAQALNLASAFPTAEVCRAVSAATRNVCAGEISQTFERGNAALSLEAYFRIIELKTAELFELSCRLGAEQAGYSSEFAAAAARYGRHLGTAYQIFDDVADFIGDEGRIGKTLGTDLASGKFTLPLLVLLDQLPPAERTRLTGGIASGTVNLDRVSALISEYQVLPRVREYFEAELTAGDADLEPFAGLPPVEYLGNLSRAIRSLTSGNRRFMRPLDGLSTTDFTRLVFSSIDERIGLS